MWTAGSPENAYSQGMADALKANRGGFSWYELGYKPPRDYPDAYTQGWDAHYRK